MIAYLEDGRYPIDNNAVERAIRPLAIGRKKRLAARGLTPDPRAARAASLGVRLAGHHAKTVACLAARLVNAQEPIDPA